MMMFPAGNAIFRRETYDNYPAARAIMQCVFEGLQLPIDAALRACRRDLARQANVPPYVIFHDSTLRELAQLRPRSDADLAHVSGVGTRKRETYGAAFLAVIAQFA